MLILFILALAEANGLIVPAYLWVVWGVVTSFQIYKAIKPKQGVQ